MTSWLPQTEIYRRHATAQYARSDRLTAGMAKALPNAAAKAIRSFAFFDRAPLTVITPAVARNTCHCSRMSERRLQKQVSSLKIGHHTIWIPTLADKNSPAFKTEKKDTDVAVGAAMTVARFHIPSRYAFPKSSGLPSAEPLLPFSRWQYPDSSPSSPARVTSHMPSLHYRMFHTCEQCACKPYHS